MKSINLFILSLALFSSMATVPVLAHQMGDGMMPGMGGKPGTGNGMMDKMMSGMSAPDKKQMKTQKPKMKKMMMDMKPADRMKMMDEMMAMPPSKRMAAMQKMFKHHNMGGMKGTPGKSAKQPKKMGGPPMPGGKMGGDM